MISHAPSAVATLTDCPRIQAVKRPGAYDYLLRLPNEYLLAPGKRWPLLLFLHGSAERGDDVWAVARQGPPRLLAEGVELSEAEAAAAGQLAEEFILVAPQCPAFEVWDDNAVLALLDDVATELEVDAGRVCLTGLSMGGFGVWSLGVRHPQRFAALAPVCGGGRLSDVARSVERRPAALRGLGVWAFHGGQDFIVPAEESIRMVDALQQAGVPEVQLTLYPEVGHDAWPSAYGEPALYSWLLAQGR